MDGSAVQSVHGAQWLLLFWLWSPGWIVFCAVGCFQQLVCNQPCCLCDDAASVLCFALHIQCLHSVLHVPSLPTLTCTCCSRLLLVGVGGLVALQGHWIWILVSEISFRNQHQVSACLQSMGFQLWVCRGSSWWTSICCDHVGVKCTTHCADL